MSEPNQINIGPQKPTGTYPLGGRHPPNKSKPSWKLENFLYGGGPKMSANMLGWEWGGPSEVLALNPLAVGGILQQTVHHGMKMDNEVVWEQEQGEEVKFLDNVIDTNPVASTGFVTSSIVNIREGLGAQERLGRKITLVHIGWNFQIKLALIDEQPLPASSDTVRMIVYLDKQCNGAAITATDLLAEASLRSFRNLNNKGRFVIFMDELYDIEYTGLSWEAEEKVSQASIIHTYRRAIDLQVEIDYDGSPGAIGDITSNNVSVFMISSQGTAVVDSHIRIRYTDW